MIAFKSGVLSCLFQFIIYVKYASAFCMWKGMTVNLRMNHCCCQLRYALLLLLPPPSCFTLSVHVHLFRHFVLTTMTLLLALQIAVLPLKPTRQISSHTAPYMAPSVPPVYVSWTVPFFFSHRRSNKAGDVNRHATNFFQVRRSFEWNYGYVDWGTDIRIFNNGNCVWYTQIHAHTKLRKGMGV
jgi:hypothetical protein